MNVHVDAFGLPVLAAISGVQVVLDASLNSLGGLIESLAGQFGPVVRETLLDAAGALDPEVLLMVNGREVIGTAALAAYRFADGDRVKFILMVGGG